jgi:hypothetical protein
MKNACVIKLNDQRLYADLPPALVQDLLADIVTRYEGFFTFGDSVYPEGQPALLFKVLSDGYGLAHCAESVGLDVVDLGVLRVQAKAVSDPVWKELHAGRTLAAIFASTINCS